MAILQCRHCGGEIDSDARRTQCRECRALFPFECAICAQKLRSPFPVFEDERHLTMDASPLPLCDEHFLRKCPDCAKWFSNDENPGYFRCLECATTQNARLRPEWSDAAPETYGDETYSDDNSRGAPAVIGASTSASAGAGAGIDSNVLVLGAAGCAFLALMGWFLMGH